MSQRQPLLQPAPQVKRVLVGWGKDKRREAAVINLEVMNKKKARIMLFAVLAAVGFAIAIDSTVAWNKTPMVVTDVDEPAGKFTSEGIIRTEATFLSVARMRWAPSNTGAVGFINVNYVVTFRDHNDKEVAKYTGNDNGDVGTQQLSCSFSTCSYMYQPGWNSAVYFPAGGILRVTLEITDFQKSFPNPFFNPYTDMKGDVEYRDSDSPWYILETIVRYISIIMLIPHFMRYRRLMKGSSDPLRPEHTIIKLMFIFMIMYCNPLSGIAYLNRTGKDVDTLVIILLLQVPQVSISYLKGAIFGLVVSIKMPKAKLNAYYATGATMTLLVLLQISFCVSENSAFGTLDASFAVSNANSTSLAIAVLYMFFQVVAMLYVVVNLFGCSNCWGISRTLKMFPYGPTRDRQLGIRMLRPIIVMLILWQGAVALMTSPDKAGVGSVVLLSLVTHTLAYTTAPVFQTGDEDTPPSPLSDEWKTMVWRPQWLKWINETPGGLALYPFVTAEEETQFWELQKSSDTDAGYIHFFNYERCLWSLHFSATAYDLDAHSPLVAAVVAAIVIGTSSVDVNLPVHVDVIPKQKASKKKAPVGRVMNVEDPFKIIRVINSNSMQVVLGRQDGLLVISFRGSSNVKNWKDDLKFPRIPWSEMSEEGRNSCCYTTTPLVHKGFLSVWNSVSELVFDVVEKYKQESDSVILVTGHSLGGATATLASYALAKHYENINFALWTYGSPYCGNTAFATLHAALVKGSFRVVNENDAVATTSFTFDNCHVGKQVTLGINGGMITIDPPYFEKWWAPTRWLWNSALAHAMIKYKDAITSSYQVVNNEYFTNEAERERLTLPGWVASTKDEAGFQDEGCGNTCCCGSRRKRYVFYLLAIH